MFPVCYQRGYNPNEENSRLGNSDPLGKQEDEMDSGTLSNPTTLRGHFNYVQAEEVRRLLPGGRARLKNKEEWAVVDDDHVVKPKALNLEYEIQISFVRLIELDSEEFKVFLKLFVLFRMVKLKTQ